MVIIWQLFLKFVVIVAQAKIKADLIVTLFRSFVGGFWFCY